MYTKEPLTIEEQIARLLERGLQINPEDKAAELLSHISYYRLAGYWWPMQADKTNHIFKPNSRFKDVVSLYNFDRELRLLLFKVIEKIEISLRTKLIYHLSHEFDPWWFQNSTLFKSAPDLVKTLTSLDEEIERSKDVFIKEHRKKHLNDPRFPPSWKALELTSFGNLSKLYSSLLDNIASKDIIAREFGTVNHSYLPSWLQDISQIRNYCAHHSRVWNKNLPGRPKLLSKPPFSWIIDVPKEHEMEKIYIHLCCMKYLLDRIHPSNHLTSEILMLLEKYPNVDPNALGMKPNWNNEPLWA